MKTFYFNTGVRLENSPALGDGRIARGGTMQIPFDCEGVPEGATFDHGSDNPEPGYPGEIVREIHNSALVSKYAHFRPPVSPEPHPYVQKSLRGEQPSHPWK